MFRYNLLFLIAITIACSASSNKNDFTPSNIYGEWRNLDDTLWKFNFNKDGSCIEFYNSKKIGSLSFKFQNESCDSSYKITEKNDLFLEMTDKSTSLCYEIIGLDNDYLSYISTPNGKIFHFIRIQ